MTFEVWHRDDPTFMDTDAATLAGFPAGYTHVAMVETDHVGRVFQLTNHIDSPWWENEGVTAVKRSRSTSVGDVVVNPTERRRWTVQMIGLKEF